jgi:hypothetical protein
MFLCIVLPDDGLYTRPKHVALRNIQQIYCYVRWKKIRNISGNVTALRDEFYKGTKINRQPHALSALPPRKLALVVILDKVEWVEAPV